VTQDQKRPHFSQGYLDELRSRVVLSALISQSVPLKKAGREYRACCPFHNEKTPSFCVNDDKGFYHCFGCSAHGDAVRWMVDHSGLCFVDAVVELAARAGMALPEGVAVDPRPAGIAAPIVRDSVRPDRPDEYVSSEEFGAAILSRAVSTKAPLKCYFEHRRISPFALVGRMADLAFCPSAPTRKWRIGTRPESVPLAPAMVARLRRPDPRLPSDQWPVTGLHVTFLNDDYTGKREARGRDGRLLPQRKMLGTIQGSCVVLGRYERGEHLVVGEGMESTLSGLEHAVYDALETRHVACALAALSLNNLQGYPLLDARGALPVWNLRPDMKRDALRFAHPGPVTLLVDADMKPVPVRLNAQGRETGPKIAERARGPFVIREISSEERSTHCGQLACAGWRDAGTTGLVTALRPRMGMDFNDMGRAGL
jgi:DNA primase